MRIGTTYSHRQISYLNLDQDKSFTTVLSLGFDLLRLGCYWNEIQPNQHTYDFSAIKCLLDRCEKQAQAVILTVGMKAPRWPEFYFPVWLETPTPEGAQNKVISFIERCIGELCSYMCISHWQVENEPFDPSGPKSFKIPQSLLKEEIACVRSRDTRPVILTVWGNELLKRQVFIQASEFVDSIGIDLYYQEPVMNLFVRGPRDSSAKIQEVLINTRKPYWITELQGEPWGNLLPKSFTYQTLEENFTKALEINPDVILWWGIEYWLQQQAHGNSLYLETVQKLLKTVPNRI